MNLKLRTANLIWKSIIGATLQILEPLYSTLLHHQKQKLIWRIALEEMESHTRSPQIMNHICNERISTTINNIMRSKRKRDKDNLKDIRRWPVLYAVKKEEKPTSKGIMKVSTSSRKKLEERRSWKDKKRRLEEHWALERLIKLKF